MSASAAIRAAHNRTFSMVPIVSIACAEPLKNDNMRHLTHAGKMLDNMNDTYSGGVEGGL